MQILLIISLVIAVVAVIFAVSNTAPAEVSFLGFEIFEGSLALILILSMIVGVLISTLASSPSFVKNKWGIRNLNKKLQETQLALNEKTAQLEEAEKTIKEQEIELELAKRSSAEKEIEAAPESVAPPAEIEVSQNDINK